MSYLTRLITQSGLSLGDRVFRSPVPIEAAHEFELEELIETAPEPVSSRAAATDRPGTIYIEEQPDRSLYDPRPQFGDSAIDAPRPRVAVQPLATERAEVAAEIAAPDAVHESPAMDTEVPVEYLLKRVLAWVAAAPDADAAPPPEHHAIGTAQTLEPPIELNARVVTPARPETRIDEAGEFADDDEATAPEPTAVRHIGTPRRAVVERERPGDARRSDSDEDIVVSIGTISVTVEAPAPIAVAPQRVSTLPVVRESRTAERLARHYLRP